MLGTGSGTSRDAQDRFAAESQRRAGLAIAAGRFDREIVSVTTGCDKKKGAAILCDRDEHPRPDVTLEGLAALKPAFSRTGTVTAGNASGLNDGAAVVLLASEAAVTEYGLTPMAR